MLAVEVVRVSTLFKKQSITDTQAEDNHCIWNIVLPSGGESCSHNPMSKTRASAYMYMS